MSDATETISSLCDTAFLRFGDLERAVTFIKGEVFSIEEGRDEVIAALIDRGVKAFYADRRHKEIVDLRDIPRAGPPVPGPAARTGNGLAAVEAAIARSILDTFPMPKGQRLGDCTGADLDAYARQDENRATGYMLRVKLFRALREHTPAEKQVRECVSGAKADAIYESVLTGGAGHCVSDTHKGDAHPAPGTKRKPKPKAA